MIQGFVGCFFSRGNHLKIWFNLIKVFIYLYIFIHATKFWLYLFHIIWRRSTEGKSLGVQRSLCVLFPCEMPVTILEKFPEHIFRLELLRKLTGGRGKQTLLTGFGEGFPWISKIVILPRSKFTSNYEWVNQSLNKFFLILLMVSEIRRSPVELGSLSHYLPGVLYIPRWWSPDFF